MRVRQILAMLIACAMLFGPIAMPAGAMAMSSVDRHAQVMADDEHCDDQSSDGSEGKATADSCCVAMCVALAVTPAAPVEARFFARIVDRASSIQFIPGSLEELATPPPRRA